MPESEMTNAIIKGVIAYIIANVLLLILPLGAFFTKRKWAKQLIDRAPNKIAIGMPEKAAVDTVTELCAPELHNSQPAQTLPDGSVMYIWALKVPDLLFLPMCFFPTFCGWTAVCAVTCKEGKVTSVSTYRIG